MKTSLKAAIATVLVIAFGIFFNSMTNMSLGEDEDSVNALLFQDLMLEAKDLFLEKSDPVQLTTMDILNMEGLSILRAKDGTPVLETENGLADINDYLDEESVQRIRSVMSEYKAGVAVFNIKVTPESVLFYTHYRESGCVGFLYEKELGNTTEYDVISIIENWKLFCRLD